MLPRDLPTNRTTDFRAAAVSYVARGWTTIPLSLDDNGLPKRPFTEGWQKLTLDPSTIDALPWNRAEGIGIVLGAASGNLGAIDIDDEELAARVVAWLVRSKCVFSIVWTARKRIHVYVREPKPSKSRAFKIAWNGRLVGIELKSTGTQIAAPPTPGYTSLKSGAELWASSLEDGWAEIVAALGLIQSGKTTPKHDADREPRVDVASVLQGVSEGDRDNQLFRFAAKLRNADVPREWAERLVLEAAANCQPPFPRTTALAKVEGAYSRYIPAPDQPNLQPNDLLVGGELFEESGADLLASSEVDAQLTYLPILGSEEHLVVGWSNLLAGYPRSGKTELLVRLLREWLDRGLSILFITEEPRSMWKARLSCQPGDWSGLRLIYGLGQDPSAMLARAVGGAQQVVVVDAIRNLLRFEDENDNSEVARKVNPWVAAAREASKTLLMVHHMRKGSGQHGEGIAGGHALLGAFDIALELIRDNTKSNRRILRPYCRIISPPELLYELNDNGAMVHLGAPDAVSLAETQQRVLEGLTGEWRTTKEIHASLGEMAPSEEQVRLSLKALAEERAVERDPAAHLGAARGKTHRWRRADAWRDG